VPVLSDNNMLPLPTNGKFGWSRTVGDFARNHDLAVSAQYRAQIRDAFDDAVRCS